jgi:hypothetical protein
LANAGQTTEVADIVRSGKVLVIGNRRAYGTRMRWRLVAVLIAAAIAGAAVLAPSIGAQPPPPPTPPATPATVGPPPDIAGEWSITRTWYRRCPRCGFPVIRTTPWEITQTGQTVRVDRGPRGVIVGAPGGGGYLSLEGPETGGFDVQRFWYATLHVSPSGNSFEGQFGGSETIQNPCGSSPPIVTCFASAGWIRAYRISPVATVPTPPGPPTVLPPAPVETATPLATHTSQPYPTTTPTPLPTSTPSPSPPPPPLFLPSVRS